MAETMLTGERLTEDVYVRALKARDARFDGVFFVGITSTSIYCRPVCPARVSRPNNRRFFTTAAAAESAGYRPCRRCRPELAPGRALVDAVSRLARSAMLRIAAGALNGRSVGELASELCVSERHLRRALEREAGVSPLELAQTHRLLLAKRLLTDTDLPITRVAFSSGFQSLRRFNVAFRDRYGMTPSTLRRAPARTRRRGPSAATPEPGNGGTVRLTLAYRAPYDWDSMLRFLQRDAAAGVDRVDGARYASTVSIEGHTGFVVADTSQRERRRGEASAVVVDVSTSLLPVLMQLLARLRQLLDLDAEPSVIDACLQRNGLAAHVRARPGLRIPGAMDGFDAALRMLLRGRAEPASRPSAVYAELVRRLGDPLPTGIAGLTHAPLTAARIADAGTRRLTALGIPDRLAHAALEFARAQADGAFRLDPGADVDAVVQSLRAVPGIGDGMAAAIAARALGWPDTFNAADPVLQRAAGGVSAQALRRRAEAWRPWRAYAATHLRQAATARAGYERPEAGLRRQA